MGTTLTDDIRKAIKAQLTTPPKRVGRRKMILAGGGPPRRNRGLRWPFLSASLGVAPEQAEEAEAVARSRGVPVEFDRETGDAIITGPKQYDNLANASGMKTGRDGYDIPEVKTGRQVEKIREGRRKLINELANTGPGGGNFTPFVD